MVYVYIHRRKFEQFFSFAVGWRERGGERERRVRFKGTEIRYFP